MTELSGWGRYPRRITDIVRPHDPAEVERLQSALPPHIARGNGRAYGDAAIGVQATVDCRTLDRMKKFDPATGLLMVEAGVLLSDIIACFLPHGFFPSVVPGTKLVTVGGMIASDVHGKNHHRVGGFGRAVDALELVLPSGERDTCSLTENPDLFNATIGGMGLTGTIVEACVRLQPVETGWIRQRTIVATDLDQAVAALATHDQTTYSVAWIDCVARGPNLGRSLIYLGEHASRADLARLGPDLPPYPATKPPRLSVPFDFPGFALNRLSVAAFNQLYFWRGARGAGTEILIPWDQYFFPLDGIEGWNRIYGRRGFLQHQCVLPEISAHRVLGDILERVAARGQASFLTVLKKLSAGTGLLSFPMPGYTLTLDFAFSEEILGFLDEIDSLVTDAGGRLYLAKDGRQSPATFESGYPALGKFREIRKAIGADRSLQSYQSKRLLI
jgi:decaprenylphospho-beta-D-ribofuranose 2-oxidase